jgi:acyl-CoA thioester hydrolase
MNEPARRFSHRHQIRARFAETDAMGVVYYSNYLAYFEVARVEYLRSAGILYRDIEDAGVSAAVIQAHVRYVVAARFDDLLTIATRVAEMTRVRFRIEYEVWREADNTLVVEGYTEHALVDRASFRPIRIPPEIREKIERFERAGERA